jgi:hypothetical protein
MNWKELFKSKSFYTGLASIAAGVGMVVNGDTSNGITTIVVGISTIFIRDSIAGVKK